MKISALKLFPCFFVLLSTRIAGAAVLTVDSTADNTTAGDGFCTLREAIQEATLLAGAGPFECGAPTLGGSDTIVMDAAVAGMTFTVLSAYTLSNDGAIIIEGSGIVLDAPGLGFVLIVNSDLNQIRNLSIQNASIGIEVRSTADGTVIGGTTGAARVRVNDHTSAGIRIAGATNTTIRNVQAADNVENIDVNSGSNVTIRQCTLGLDAGGVVSGTSTEVGVRIDGGSMIVVRDSFIGDNAIGVAVFGGDTIRVRSNFIGTNFAGTAERGNGTGIFVSDATQVSIGGDTPSFGNLISGNSLGIGAFGVAGVEIENNRIGTNAAATAILENLDGIILNSATDTLIEANVISGQGLTGVYVDGGSSAALTGNLIGTNAALDDLPNGRNAPQAAVAISGEATLIGNTIAFHDDFADSRGVLVDGGAVLAGSIDNCISGNSIGVTDDSALDIDLSGNYWGDPAGPTVLPLGAVHGDSVEEIDPAGSFDYSMHLAASPVPCP